MIVKEFIEKLEKFDENCPIDIGIKLDLPIYIKELEIGNLNCYIWENITDIKYCTDRDGTCVRLECNLDSIYPFKLY